MSETTDQSEVLLLNLERRIGVNRECSEEVETQLKVLLVQQSREHAPNRLVARTAKTLAECLETRGDREQAAQYALMAANLDRMHGGARPPGGDRPVGAKAVNPRPDSSPRQKGATGVGPEPDSFGQLLKRQWSRRWASWFRAWGWVLKRERHRGLP